MINPTYMSYTIDVPEGSQLRKYFDSLQGSFKSRLLDIQKASSNTGIGELSSIRLRQRKVVEPGDGINVRTLYEIDEILSVSDRYAELFDKHIREKLEQIKVFKKGNVPMGYEEHFLTNHDLSSLRTRIMPAFVPRSIATTISIEAITPIITHPEGILDDSGSRATIIKEEEFYPSLYKMEKSTSFYAILRESTVAGTLVETRKEFKYTNCGSLVHIVLKVMAS